jgi:hypothetical protein
MKFFTSKFFFSALTATSNASHHWTAIQEVVLLSKILFDLVIGFQCSAAAAAAAGPVSEKLGTRH